jgi:hypothetical protein
LIAHKQAARLLLHHDSRYRYRFLEARSPQSREPAPGFRWGAGASELMRVSGLKTRGAEDVGNRKVFKASFFDQNCTEQLG